MSVVVSRCVTVMHVSVAQPETGGLEHKEAV